MGSGNATQSTTAIPLRVLTSGIIMVSRVRAGQYQDANPPTGHEIHHHLVLERVAISGDMAVGLHHVPTGGL